ncbi:hypothetical protein CKM354_000388700 [Cercospora kikuchii]|uniref:Rhodopsin domain-containing protein n=1 Tax=Cercospora kikuchii TaxID=84275 RepID=A0A9P3CD05_9PEZI|nr:uncharacterized protein CKM354_000388700 [Cercospora kikuchii]GIZ40553.1 hypothetical protein CKM354_000388700 [Cercospora kikuchii]
MPRREGYQNAVSFTISICLVFTICVAIIRLWIRRHAYGSDDAIIAAATITSLGQIGASYVSYAKGLGKPWTRIAVQDDLRNLNQASVASLVLFLITLYLSKIAMIAFLSRITQAPAQIKLYHVCNGIVAALGLVSIIVATAGCSSASGYYWAFEINRSTCSSQHIRWQIITVFDCVTEALLLGLPVHLVWGLQMRLLRKAVIVTAFWVRFPTLAFSIARSHYTLRLSGRESDAGLDSALVNIWMEIELAYAIAASTFSALKTFTENFNTGFGVAQLRGKSEGSYGVSDDSGCSGHKAQPQVEERAVQPCELAADQRQSLRSTFHQDLSSKDLRGEPYELGCGSSAGSTDMSDDMAILRVPAHPV